MPTRYSTAQAAVVDQDNRNMAQQIAGVLPMSEELDDIWAAIDTGPIGIQSASNDIDALCLGGGEFTYNPNASTGLIFAYNAGRFHNGYQELIVASGTLTLAASSTNYIELSNAGIVYSNTSGFTAGRMPLMTAVTSTSAITTVTNNRALLSFCGPAGINGTLLSATAATKSLDKSIAGSIAAATELLFTAPVTGTISGVTFVNSTAVAASDSNLWAFSAVNKGAAGTGTTAVLDTGADNSTHATGGSALVAYSSRALVLNATSGNLNCNKGDTIAFTLTPTGSPTALTETSIRVDFAFTT